MEYTQGVRFDTLSLSPEIMRAIEKRGIEVSTPVQAGCIPPMMDWQDVIAKAPTGTGKTFAYGIPIVEHVDPEDESVQAVILAPTRELAIQITDELRDLAEFKPGVRTVCLYGGQPIGRQIDTLKKRPQIVVATPGRLSDHMKRRTVRVDTAKTVVLDEADRMLDMGFIHDVTRLLDKMNKRKNLGLFSATISREVMDISWVYQRDPVEITVRPVEESKPDITQYRIDLDGREQKLDTIAALITHGEYERAIAFCNTKNMTDRLAGLLKMRGISCEAIHGDIQQRIREKTLEKFKNGEIAVLVATDVAARGIDVEDVDAVINYMVLLGWSPRGEREFFTLKELEEKVYDLIRQDLPVTYLDENHVSIGGAIHPCTGPRIHVPSTGQVKDFHLLYHFMHDIFNKRYLLVGCVGKDNLDKLRRLEEQAKFLRPIVPD